MPKCLVDYGHTLPKIVSKVLRHVSKGSMSGCVLQATLVVQPACLAFLVWDDSQVRYLAAFKVHLGHLQQAASNGPRL